MSFNKSTNKILLSVFLVHINEARRCPLQQFLPTKRIDSMQYMHIPQKSVHRVSHLYSLNLPIINFC